MVERVERKERAQARAKATANAPGPTEIRSHLVRTELLRASVWLGLALLPSACGNRGALVLPEEAPPPMPALNPAM